MPLNVPGPEECEAEEDKWERVLRERKEAGREVDGEAKRGLMAYIRVGPGASRFSLFGFANLKLDGAWGNRVGTERIPHSPQRDPEIGADEVSHDRRARRRSLGRTLDAGPREDVVDADEGRDGGWGGE